MKNLYWKVLLAAPLALAVSRGAIAAEAAVVKAETSDVALGGAIAEPTQLAQVTSVSELSDVQPTDWAFTALQRLVEEYGCLEGYPDRTFRGNKPLTRYEFAAGLNACLDVVIQLIGQGSDLDTIRRLQEEFAAELATIRGRVDTLETDVAELQANQFSTTTKLRGQLDAHLVVPFSNATAYFDDTKQQGASVPVTGTNQTGGGPEAGATFEYRARLNFDTSFTGEDRLRIRLQASDDAGALANTESGLANQSSRRNGLQDNVGLDDIYYKFPVGKRLGITVGANSVNPYDLVTSTISPFDGPSVAYAGRGEFYDLYPAGKLGVGANISFSDNLVLDVGFASRSSNVNTPAGGIFNNDFYVAQLNLLTKGFLKAAVTYIDSNQNTPGTPDTTIAGLVTLDFGGFQLSGHYASTRANGGGDLNSYIGGIFIPSFLGKNNKLGIYGGVSPALNRNPVIAEAFYGISVNDSLTLTPSVIYADNDSGVGDQNNVYGALRATFKF